MCRRVQKLQAAADGFAVLMLALTLTPTPIAGASLKAVLHPVREFLIQFFQHR